MGSVVHLVIDVLKPYDPPLVAFTEHLEAVDGVSSAAVAVLERDDEVQNVEVTLQGEALDLDRITEVVENLGASVHSVDQVVCGHLPAGVDRTAGGGAPLGQE